MRQKAGFTCVKGRQKGDKRAACTLSPRPRSSFRSSSSLRWNQRRGKTLLIRTCWAQKGYAGSSAETEEHVTAPSRHIYCVTLSKPLHLWVSARASLSEPGMMGLHLPGVAGLTHEPYISWPPQVGCDEMVAGERNLCCPQSCFHSETSLGPQALLTSVTIKPKVVCMGCPKA